MFYLIRTLLVDELRFLTFRSVSPAIRTHWPLYLAFGLFSAWVAGIGRYWDNPRAELWQHLGLGSVAYVFVLSFLLWVLLAPLRPANGSIRTVLMFVALTSPPAVLYAIPVERVFAPSDARALNVWFLAIVAVWRVSLFAHFLRHVADLPLWVVVIATLLPLTIIVNVLAMLNLEHVVFDLMGGLGRDSASGNDTAYFVVRWLALLSVLCFPFLLLAYIASVYSRWQAR